MTMTKVFKSGNSQAVRIPKEFHIYSDVVEILKVNDELVIREKPKSLAKAFKLLAQLPDDFFAEERKDTPPQKREFFE